ncbi:hypothetical protein [Vacuolonema iberomarrocanum]|uniref:hypothetical protein n=1 Tax=Vacuolonema iberomarrocanum TaxID=3454632 RepID=UPI0019DB24E1|nr:hypothetical protein [filamentous cyanobacterium LEGE 07170]
MTPQIKTISELRQQLQLPQLLDELIRTGRWTHPGDRIMESVVPFITDPLDLLPNREAMQRESGPLMAPSETESLVFHEYRGAFHKSRPLPWIDVEKTLFIAVNRRIGDDVGIALDYRDNPDEPSVVGGDYHSGKGLQYRLIANTFCQFAKSLGLLAN